MDHYEDLFKQVSFLGLWKESIHDDLLWEPEGAGLEPLPQELNLPSWTPLSHHGSFCYNLFGKMGASNNESIDTLTIIDWLIIWSGPRNTSQILEHKLLVSSRLCKLEVQCHKGMHRDRVLDAYCLFWEDRNVEIGVMMVDNKLSPMLPEFSEVYCLEVQRQNEPYGQPEAPWVALLVLELITDYHEADGDIPVFRRIGVGSLGTGREERDEHAAWPDPFAGLEMKTISLK